eukprot:4151536-Amphidinium_carterae.1
MTSRSNVGSFALAAASLDNHRPAQKQLEHICSGLSFSKMFSISLFLIVGTQWSAECRDRRLKSASKNRLGGSWCGEPLQLLLSQLACAYSSNIPVGQCMF